MLGTYFSRDERKTILGDLLQKERSNFGSSVKSESQQDLAILEEQNEGNGQGTSSL